MNRSEISFAVTEQLLTEARALLASDPPESDRLVERAWLELHRAEQQGAPSTQLVDTWKCLARFIVCELAPVAIKHGSTIRDARERVDWYRATSDWLRSVFVGYRALQQRGAIVGQSIAIIAPEMETLLAELEVMATAAQA